MILQEYCNKLSETMRKKNLMILPLVDKEIIKNVIIKYANVIAVCINGQIAGYCAFYMNNFESRIAYITLIAVDKNFQSNHIGTIMLDYIKTTAVINDFRGVRLEVYNNNTNAIMFYEHNDFFVETSASNDSKYMRCDL